MGERIFQERLTGVIRIRYFGGKSRIAKDIAAFISDEAKISNGTFVSLFCGSCAVETKVAGYNRIVCNDAHPYLIAMLRDAQSGRIFPTDISEEEYSKTKETLDADPGLSGFVGFGCSFSGIWFGSYAKNDPKNNYAKQSSNSLYKSAKQWGKFEFRCGDYADVAIVPGSVVYADPPYKGRPGYSTGAFDSIRFWKFAREISEKGSSVFISEESGPDWATAIWEKQVRRWVNNTGDRKPFATEKLFYLPPGG